MSEQEGERKRKRERKSEQTTRGGVETPLHEMEKCSPIFGMVSARPGPSTLPRWLCPEITGSAARPWVHWIAQRAARPRARSGLAEVQRQDFSAVATQRTTLEKH